MTMHTDLAAHDEMRHAVHGVLNDFRGAFVKRIPMTRSMLTAMSLLN
jgi:hypothetical protein